MTISKKYSKLVVVSVFASILALGIGLQSSTAQTTEFNPVENSLGDIEIQTTFHFVSIGSVSLGSFSVFDQQGGFKDNEPTSFRLVGLADIDKIGIYELADRSFQRRDGSIDDPQNKFDVDVKIVQHEEVLHEFKYRACRMIDYKVKTLFDADETFSGKTKFAIVDIYEFQCRGYNPNTPLFEILIQKVQKGDTTSTLDLKEGLTWKDIDYYKTRGFGP